MKKLNVRIIQVENGYIVMEDSPEQRFHLGKQWVAQTIADLRDLINALALDANQSTEGE